MKNYFEHREVKSFFALFLLSRRRIILMKWISIFQIPLFLLASCAPARIVDAPPEPTVTLFIAPTPTSTPELITPLPTATQIACDPFNSDFCITDGHIILQRPVKPPANDTVDPTYRYGSTADSRREPHHGVEFLNEFGTPIYAAGEGVVVFAGPDNSAVYSPWVNFYGNLVVIRHDDDIFTLHAHLSKIDVKANQQVRAGDKIGEVGQSGVATGSHLHFEVRRCGDGTDYFSTQNPELWLFPNSDEYGHPLGAMTIAILDQNSKFQFAEFTARYHLDKNGPKIKSYYVVTYSRDMALGEENAGLGDLSPGYYRIALKYNGQIYDRWVEVKSGKLTQVVLVVK